jgi:adenosylcobinamide-GDP ribazoletransferase
VTQQTRTSSWRTALSLFTVIPVARSACVSKETAGRAVAWLPVLGVLLGATAAGVMFAAELGGDAAPRRLLAAALAVAVLGLLTGGLHLDGLADTVDGLGSRHPRAEALDVMRRSDVGPLGVAALLIVVLLQVTSLAVLAPGAPASVALIAAVTTSRVAVVLTAGSPAARADGFGALISGASSVRFRVLVLAALLTAVTAGGAAAGGADLVVRCLVAVVAGLGTAGLMRRLARRRLGGMTGDVFGAMIEMTTATVLLVLALSW